MEPPCSQPADTRRAHIATSHREVTRLTCVSEASLEATVEFVKYLLIGVSVSLDELAVGTIKGVQVKHMRRVDPWITGLYFAVFQGVMLIIGFYGASLFSKGSSAVTEWIADGLLMLIGANMVREAFSNNDDDAKQQDLLAKMDVKSMSVLSLTMSLDALAVGVSLALDHRLDIWWASLSAALVSLAITVPAMFVGHKLGHKVGAKGGAFGGAILILLGLYELLQYYKVF